MISRRNLRGAGAIPPRPLVSVIVPAFNAEPFIARAIESVLAQTCKHLEVLVVDDGSRDRTAEIVKDYAHKDSRVRLLCQTNQGVAAARNAAIASARGEYIAPLDADDLWCTSKLQRQVDVLSMSPFSVGLVYAWSQRIDKAGEAVGRCSGADYEGSVFLPLLVGNFIGNASAPLIRRECFQKLGGYSPEFWRCGAQGCEDWDLYLRIAEQYRFLVIPECLVKYRQSDGSMSADPDKMRRSHRILLDSVRSRQALIPAFVYRWSTGSYSLYLAGICTRRVEPGKALARLLGAVCLDPVVLLNTHFHRLLFKNLAQMLGMDARMWKKRQARFRKGETGTTNTRATMAGATGSLWSGVRNRRHAELLRLQRTLNLTAGDKRRAATE